MNPLAMQCAAFVLGVLSVGAGSNKPWLQKGPQVDYQRVADKTPWKWETKKTSIQHYVKAYQGMFRVSLKPDESSHLRESQLQIHSGTRLIFETKVHDCMPFRIQDNRLYYAHYWIMSTGCELVAVDLLTKKELWRTHLQGMGPIDHSKYRNRVTLDLQSDVAIIYGKESAGRYVEFVSLKDGQTVGHRRYPAE